MRNLLMQLLIAAAFVAVTFEASAAEPKRVLVLHSFGAHFAPFSYFSDQFRSDLVKQSAQGLDVYESSLELARFGDTGSEAAFVDYLQALFAKRRLDLVISIGGPALRFIQKYRNTLFHGTPALLTAADARVVDRAALTSEDSVVAVNLTVVGSIEQILTLLPDTKNIFVAIGASPIEGFWADEILHEAQPFAGRAHVVSLASLSFEQMLKRSSQLPPHSAIFYADIWVDAAGVPQEEDTALGRLHAVANAPLFGLYDKQLGKGIVGGRLLSMGGLSQTAAGVAARILAGERPADIKTPPLEQAVDMYDSRELARWNIDPSRLQADSTVLFREPSVWEKYTRQIITAAAVIAMQGLLIFALLVNRRRLRLAELRRRRAEEEAVELNGRLINSQEDERARLARELHDDVTQRLAVLAIDAGREENQASTPMVAASMRRFREGLVRLSEDVHALSYRLHPSILRDLGLIEALKAECEQVERREEIGVTIDAAEIPEGLPYATTLCLFRVAQEALRNVVRHAAATKCTVAVRRHGQGLQLAVTDNGAGFNPARQRGRPSLGHASMRQRVRLVAGKLDIDSAFGRGTTILAWVPVEEKPHEAAARAAG